MILMWDFDTIVDILLRNLILMIFVAEKDLSNVVITYKSTANSMGR
jgi:hypothetical protein